MSNITTWIFKLKKKLTGYPKKALHIRSIPFWIGRVRGGLCPLAPVDCTYRVATNVCEIRHMLMMGAHIRSHELSDRMKEKQLLQAYFSNGSRQLMDPGTKNCMLCFFQARGYYHREVLFAHLMADHQKEDRGSVLKDIFFIIRTYLEDLSSEKPWKDVRDSVALANECKAAGIPPFGFIYSYDWLYAYFDSDSISLFH